MNFSVVFGEDAVEQIARVEIVDVLQRDVDDLVDLGGMEIGWAIFGEARSGWTDGRLLKPGLVVLRFSS